MSPYYKEFRLYRTGWHQVQMGDGINGVELSKGTLPPTPSKALDADVASDCGIKLVTADEKKTVIAEFHRAHHITKKRKARLEIQPAGMHMLDYIVLTFVFVENKRRDREKSIAITSANS